MRAKQIWEVVPLPSKAKHAWDKLTLSRLTTAYFIFSVLHCIIQSAFQIRAFTINAEAGNFLFSISVAGNATDTRVPALGNGDLRLCPEAPANHKDLSHCDVIWNGLSKKNVLGPSSAAAEASVSPTITSSEVLVSSSTVAPVTPTLSSTVAPVVTGALTVVSSNPGPTAIPPIQSPPSTPGSVLSVETDDDDDDDDEFAKALESQILVRRAKFQILADVDGMTTLNLTGPGYSNTPVTLSRSCLWSLNWPVSVLENTKREDIVFIAYQFWVLGMSLVALMNESIPHIFASLLTHVLATGWSAFQITHTNSFRSDFNHYITNGACQGVPLLGNYWDERSKAEYPALALNSAALLMSAFLTWKLVKLFGWQTFKRVGASLVMNRMYKLVLSLSIAVQLGFFFLGAAVSLWLDNLFNGIAQHSADYLLLYKATTFVAVILLLPWMLSGWLSVRHEKRLGMFIFLTLTILYLGAWGVMLMADTFRWLFITWRFFGIIWVIAVLLTVISLVLGVICRYNFGKGLPRYLNAEEPLPGDDFAPVYTSDLEKFAFPSNEKPIPTFSGSFGKGADAVPPSQMFSQQRMGPRFFNPNAEPFEGPRPLPQAVTRLQGRSDESGTTLTRSASNNGSIQSYYSYSSHSHSDSVDSHGKRWVIE